MNNGQVRDLCLQLLNSEREGEVIAALTTAGLWADGANWRNYGDVENNWGQGGNQQSMAEAALVEKLVNSVDARLINEALERGIDPRGAQAPKTIRQAVSRFFEGGTGEKLATGGLLDDWSELKIREVAQGISLCATGTNPILNLTISDCGEGQTPQKIPTTIMSLSKSNKMYIPFVQGQFNQGGTGALRFCGKENLQLVVSRRNPKLLGPDPDEEDAHWGFTVVRRERPDGSGRKNSIYTYLAPVGVGGAHSDRHGDVLSFSAASLPLFPDKDGPYGRSVTFGTAIKLYDYQYLGERSNIIRGRSIFSRLDLLLPEVALPIRVYEFRTTAKRGYLEPGSRETTLTGLLRRLRNTPNVEDGFPITLPFSPNGEQLSAMVFAFKPAGTVREGEEEDETNGKKKKLGGLTRYRKREGVLFLRNGQTQATLPKDFFRREVLKLKPLADDLLVFVDCDNMKDHVREDLFMPSRDRLAENDFKGELIDGLDQALKESDVLRQLRNRRQQERMTDRMKDDKPLADVLQHLIKSSPNLTALLHLGQRISAPFNTNQTSAEEKPFKGEVYPTFFKTRGVAYGDTFKRDCPINYRMRLSFETDARDDYFVRRIEGGKFSLVWTDPNGTEQPISFTGPNLKRGLATVMASLPGSVQEGDVVSFVARVRDTRGEFANPLRVTVRPWAEHQESGSRKKDRKSADKKDGSEREKPQQLATPRMIRVFKEEWEAQTPPFDEHTAMRMESEYDAADNEIPVFRVNMDNAGLLSEIKLRRLDDGAAHNQFLYANVLTGLSLLLQYKQRGDTTNDSKLPSIEDRIEMTCRAMAPFMLALTSLGLEDFSDTEQYDGLEAATG